MNDNIKTIPLFFLFPEGWVHQNQFVCFHVYATVLLNQYIYDKAERTCYKIYYSLLKFIAVTI